MEKRIEKKILLAVDDSIHTKHAIEYAVRIESQVTNLWYSLFFVQPGVSQYLLDEAKTDMKAKAELKKALRQNQEGAQHVLDKLKNQMVRMGISEERIETVTQPKILGLAKDIMDRGQTGLYDAIVLGRRGLSRIQKTFMGSVTATVIEHATFIPVWVVDGVVKSPKIMIAIDGSESSLRALDHLGFMVGENPKVKITLFHARPKVGEVCEIDFGDTSAFDGKAVPRGARGCVDRFYAQAYQMLQAAHIDEARIDIQTSRPTVHVGRAIINAAKKGDYGTVVIGRRGISKAFFMGSVSRYVIEETEGRALWVVS